MVEALLSPEVSAKFAGLRYVTLGPDGSIRRGTQGDRVVYVDARGKQVEDEDTLERIRKLVIPPAWTEVLISTRADAHLQAQGRDARGRKQYRYHPEYRAVRDATKYQKMTAFGKVLPRIRRAVARDLRKTGMPRRKVVAIVVRLLETTCIRVGNAEYAEENESFGLTTLKNKHVSICGQKLRFRFRGKSGQDHDIHLKDMQLARLVRKCQCIPGYELFRYLDESGQPATVDSADVNEYIREVAGAAFTAKDFRTWHGTCSAAWMLAQEPPAETITARRHAVVEAVKATALKLGNRPPACRKYYIHPEILEAYEDGTLYALFAECRASASTRDCQQRVERAVMRLLGRSKRRKRPAAAMASKAA